MVNTLTNLEKEWQPLQCSCLGNLMDTGAWRAAVHGVVESDVTGQLTHSDEQKGNGSSRLQPFTCSQIQYFFLNFKTLNVRYTGNSILRLQNDKVIILQLQFNNSSTGTAVLLLQKG